MYTESDAMESFNPVTKEWCALARLKVPRAYHGLVALNGYIYAIGGFNEYTGSLSTVERYSIKDVSLMIDDVKEMCCCILGTVMFTNKSTKKI